MAWLWRNRMTRFHSKLPPSEARLALRSGEHEWLFDRGGAYALTFGPFLFVRPSDGVRYPSVLAGWISPKGPFTNITTMQSRIFSLSGFIVLTTILIICLMAFFLNDFDFYIFALILNCVIFLLIFYDEYDFILHWLVEDSIAAPSGEARRQWQRRGQGFGIGVTHALGVLWFTLGRLPEGDHFIQYRDQGGNLQFERRDGGFAIMQRSGVPGQLLRAERVGVSSASGHFSFDEAMAIGLAWLTENDPPDFLHWVDMR